MMRRWLRWMPAVVVPAVIAAAVAAGSLPAGAADPLPSRTPGQVLELAAGHTTRSLSATVEQTSNLGLPEIPATGPPSAATETSWLELLSGPHTARVYTDGPTKARIQVLDRMAERDLVWNGRDLWFYNSRDNSAVHAAAPAELSLKAKPHAGHPMPTPGEIAEKMLAAADPSTEASVGPDVQVAGRTAYNLILTPRSQQTLVGSIAIAVDGETGLPLSVEVLARGQAEPAFSVAYTRLSLGSPDPALFEFTPPPGATVKEIHPAGRSLDTISPELTSPPEDVGAVPVRPTVTGSGWDSIVAIPARSGSSPAEALLADPVLGQALVSVPGGRLLSTSLVNVLLTDDGRILAGAVPVELLQAAAAAK